VPAKAWARAHDLNQVNSLDDLKAHFRKKGQYALDWINVQEWLYVEGIREALIKDGVIELYNHLKKLRAEIFIVSHKTFFSAKSKLDLRTPANFWINQVLGKFVSVPKNNIFFEETRSLKIARIQSLEITHFVDDLYEIFDDDSYPKNVTNFLLSGKDKEKQIKNAIPIVNMKEIIAHV
jgi:hypothetical protein